MHPFCTPWKYFHRVKKGCIGNEWVNEVYVMKCAKLVALSVKSDEDYNRQKLKPTICFDRQKF